MPTSSKLVTALLAASLILNVNEKTSFAVEETKPASPMKETDQVIVKMENADVGALNGADITTLETSEEELLVTAKVPDGESLDSYIEELEKIDGVVTVEPDYLIDMEYVPNDPDVSDLQYHHDRIGSNTAWNLTQGSADVLVAVIDGGFDVNHSELVDQIAYSYNTVSESYGYTPIGDHGTHVAGIIGSSIDNNEFGAGVAPKTSLLPIHVFAGEQAYTSDVVDGIYFAVNAGADIINMSLGSYSYSYMMDEAIQYAHDKGLVIVASAGNDDTTLTHYPSSLKNVIAVGATDDYDDITDYTNYGYDQDIVAPGTNIWSTLPYDQFEPMTGTSMAAPVVSGVAALILAKEPNLTNVEVEERLLSTAKDLGYSGRDDLYGHGLVDAAAAVKAPDIGTPTVYEVYDDSTEIEVYMPFDIEGLTVTVTNARGDILATKSNFLDNFLVLNIPKQKAGTKLYVTISDSFGNEGESVETVVIDNTPPEIPLVEIVTDRSTVVKGIAEPYSTVEVWNGYNFLGETTALGTGVYQVAIDPQVAGSLIEVYAIDAAGYFSETAYTTVVKTTEKTTERIAGETRYTTAIAISKNGWTSSDTVVLATAHDFPDALAGGPLAYQEDAPILLTRSASLTPETKAEILRLGASKVIILGSRGAVSLEVEAEIRRMNIETIRIGGNNRYETASMIADRLTSSEAVVANGLNFPDVLSVSSYAAHNGIPILLTRSDRLPEETAAALRSKSKTHVIGSTGAVSSSVAAALPGAIRYGGQTRYETGYEVMTRLPMGTDKAYVATGQNFPDALAGSVLAAKNNAPILLVRNDSIPAATQVQLATYSSFGVFGGTGAVNQNVMEMLNWQVEN